jgi:hypothetical protein
MKKSVIVALVLISGGIAEAKDTPADLCAFAAHAKANKVTRELCGISQADHRRLWQRANYKSWAQCVNMRLHDAERRLSDACMREDGWSRYFQLGTNVDSILIINCSNYVHDKYEGLALIDTCGDRAVKRAGTWKAKGYKSAQECADLMSAHAKDGMDDCIRANGAGYYR